MGYEMIGSKPKAGPYHQHSKRARASVQFNTNSNHYDAGKSICNNILHVEGEYTITQR